ncbi:hypothetical protein SeLEV6574_g08384 [Synchytrium endobioticum]|uniref:Uncharacterized protein n=1 Tax=Synchytrium endobioticum TaxID=286115 RepID=A0A507C7A4_9FUNG|nr:hypothetical protein SeLEV6574_g08384 [Synchytrium endobioticum]
MDLIYTAETEEAHIVEERQRHPANRMEAHGDQEAANAGDAAGSRPRRRPRAGCVRRTNPTQNRSTTPKKRPTTPTTSPTLPPSPPSPSSPSLPPPPSPSSSPPPPSPSPPSPSRASAEGLRLTASITYRCLIQAPVQELEKLLDIAVGAGAVAFAYDDSSVDAVRDLADLTAWDAAIVGQLQRQVLRAIGYRVEHL